MIPMNLGLLDGPFVLRNLISTQGSPVPSPKFQMAPRLKSYWPSSPKRNPDILFFSLKSPGKRTLPGSPSGPLWKERPAYRAFRLYSKTSSFRFPSKGAVLRDLPFSGNQPLKSADNSYIRALQIKLMKLKRQEVWRLCGVVDDIVIFVCI